MQKIVYVLGAGFSKPLGLPIMSDFIDMAKDLYAFDTEKYGYFSHVFKFIHDRLAWVKTVYDADLNNIEEILSILEMLNILDKIEEKHVIEYKRFLIDVIEYYTPRFSFPAKLQRLDRGIYDTGDVNLRTSIRAKAYAEATEYLFPIDFVKNYVYFVLGLFNAKLEIAAIDNLFKFTCTPIENPYAEYSIITLNYDLVLENTASFLSSFATGKQIQFSSGTARNNFPVIAHLHGRIDNKNIIPPTWQKTIEKTIEEDWRTAYEILGSANHIRIIGYSLPITDSYIRYLLKAGILRNNNLKSINVICLDRWGTIKARYDDFIKLPPEKYQFSNIDVTTHLGDMAQRVIKGLLMDNVPMLPSSDRIHPFKSNS